jgi:hypothetical protein
MLILEIAGGVMLGLFLFCKFSVWWPTYLEDRAYKKQYRKAIGHNPW